jgi:hypothetical protein
MISAYRFGRDNVFVLDFGCDFVALLIQINARPSICRGLRHNSTTRIPAWCSLSTLMICSSLNRPLRIRPSPLDGS